MSDVIIFSASEELESIVKAVELGAEDYILKLLSLTLLKARIDASLSRKRLRDHEVAYTRPSRRNGAGPTPSCARSCPTGKCASSR